MKTIFRIISVFFAIIFLLLYIGFIFVGMSYFDSGLGALFLFMGIISSGLSVLLFHILQKDYAKQEKE